MIAFQIPAFLVATVAVALVQAADQAPPPFPTPDNAVARTVDVPKTAPKSAVKVPLDFVGFGFGQAWIPNYANDFSENLVQSVGQRMAVRPIIRMGGTVGDRFLWNPNQEDAIVPLGDESPNSSGTTFVLGPRFFQYLKRFPNARVTFQATLGPKLNMSSTIPILQGAVQAIGTGRLVAIALGNEVSTEYKTAKSYVEAAHKVQEEIIRELHLTGDDRKIFEVVDTLNHAALTHSPWAAEDAFKSGINSNGFVNSAAEHWYQISDDDNSWSDQTMQSQLMNHSAIVAHFSKYEQSVDYIKKHNDDVKYVLSETGSGIGKPSPPLTFGDSFGAALWSVAFNLAAMVRRVDRVHDSGRPAASHSSWVPDNSSHNSGPSVRAPFAVDPMIADFVGKSPHIVAELSIPNGGDLLCAYAGYASDTGKLDRIALVNLHMWKRSMGTPRPFQKIRLEVGSNTKNVRVWRLVAAGGAEALGYDLEGPDANITWAGEQWTWKVDGGKGHFPTGRVEEESVKVVGDVAEIALPDSEACVVWID